MNTRIAFLALVLFAVTLQAETPLREQAEKALRRGAEFFRKEVAVEGSYLWEYSEDLSKREGEGVATATQGWVQPPGTPSVGSAFLTAYEATGDRFYLDAARETAHALVRGQMQSGGWHYTIEFDEKSRKKKAYRDGGSPKGRNTTTLDDDTTQAALRFLLQMDQALGFKDEKIHECLSYALECLLKAQYPNGAWPQGYDQFPDPAKFPVKKASYPETWSRTYPGHQNYWNRYTLNDSALPDIIGAMLDAARVWGDPQAGEKANALARRCHAAAERAGDFLLIAQMPEPQPAWAQQYDFDMQPAWARKFEPPSVTGGESFDAMRVLMRLYRETGQRKFIEPIPRALDYFRRSRLPDGRLARFYELRTNKPLYFTEDYQLTYDDDDMPTHYAFKVGDRTESVAREYERLAKLDLAALKKPAKPASPHKAGPALIAEVKKAITAQDARGRWVEGGGLKYHRPKDETARIISCATFIHHVQTLSRYLAAERVAERR